MESVGSMSSIRVLLLIDRGRRKSVDEVNVFMSLNSKVHGGNMGPIWGQQDPDGPHVGPMNFAICVVSLSSRTLPLYSVHYLTQLPLDKMNANLADDIFECIFLNGNDRIPIRNSLKFVPRSPIDNKPALVQVMAWCRTGDKPLSEPMLNRFTDAYMQHLGEMS